MAASAPLRPSAVDRRPADHDVAVEQAGELAGRGAVDRLVERDLQPPVRAGGGVADQPRRQRLGAVAQLDAVDARAVAMQARAAQRHRGRLQLGARAGDDAVAGGLGPQHVERLLGGDAEPSALADGVAVMAAVTCRARGRRCRRSPRLLLDPGVAGEEGGAAGAGEEAEVLRVGLGGDRQLRLGGQLAHLRLRQLAEREAHPRERVGRERGEHVGLVLPGVDGGGAAAARRRPPPARRA